MPARTPGSPAMMAQASSGSVLKMPMPEIRSSPKGHTIGMIPAASVPSFVVRAPRRSAAIRPKSIRELVRKVAVDLATRLVCLGGVIPGLTISADAHGLANDDACRHENTVGHVPWSFGGVSGPCRMPNNISLFGNVLYLREFRRCRVYPAS
jgi:hypothetical protein